MFIRWCGRDVTRYHRSRKSKNGNTFWLVGIVVDAAVDRYSTQQSAAAGAVRCCGRATATNARVLIVGCDKNPPGMAE